MPHLLDRPIWSALGSRHVTLAEGGARARRYAPAVSPFAATADDEEASLRELGALCASGESILLAMVDPIVTPTGLVTLVADLGVQMVAAERPPPLPTHDARIEPLGWADAEAMLELAQLTKPGPFTAKSQALGAFWGVKQDGRLIAMAGQRLKQPGYTELSGVCTHPDHQGRGLGRLLSIYVTRKIFERAERPYLHAYAGNRNAIALYERLGYRHRTDINVGILKRPD